MNFVPFYSHRFPVTILFFVLFVCLSVFPDVFPKRIGT